MTERNFYKELNFSSMGHGNGEDCISYFLLIDVIAELCGRIEQLETRLDRNDNWKRNLAKSRKRS